MRVDLGTVALPVFPARAGMSLRIPKLAAWRSGVPRASGDEPGVHNVQKKKRTCSPRERG